MIGNLAVVQGIGSIEVQNVKVVIGRKALALVDEAISSTEVELPSRDSNLARVKNLQIMASWSAG